MKRIGVLRTGLLLLACLGMMLPTPVLHAASADGVPGPRTSADVDVVLHEGGQLHGQLVDMQQKPLAGTSVALRYQDRQIATTVTDPAGRFRFSGVRRGTHQIVAGPTRRICRTWNPNAAPPSARQRVRIVVGDEPVRGQDGPMGYWLGNPWVIAGLVAVAVAVPVAIHNHRASRPATP